LNVHEKPPLSLINLVYGSSQRAANTGTILCEKLPGACYVSVVITWVVPFGILAL